MVSRRNNDDHSYPPPSRPRLTPSALGSSSQSRRRGSTSTSVQEGDAEITPDASDYDSEAGPSTPADPVSPLNAEDLRRGSEVESPQSSASTYRPKPDTGALPPPSRNPRPSRKRPMPPEDHEHEHGPGTWTTILLRWSRIVQSRYWRKAVDLLPWPVALCLGIGSCALGVTGPGTGLWFVTTAHGVNLGALGYCAGTSCVTGAFYTLDAVKVDLGDHSSETLNKYAGTPALSALLILIGLTGLCSLLAHIWNLSLRYVRLQIICDFKGRHSHRDAENGISVYEFKPRQVTRIFRDKFCSVLSWTILAVAIWSIPLIWWLSQVDESSEAGKDIWLAVLAISVMWLFIRMIWNPPKMPIMRNMRARPDIRLQPRGRGRR